MADPTSPFERIRRHAEDGTEYWSAREFAALLGYTDYLDFEPVLTVAEIAADQAGHPAADHFIELAVEVLPAEGETGEPEYIADVALSRFACFLCIQHADPRNPAAALGQSYFALREIARQGAPGLTEDQLRLQLREQMIAENKALNTAAYGAGIRDPNDFALFHEHGYMGVYGGLRMRQIHARKGLKPNQHLFDNIGSTEMGIHIFRETQTRDKLQREGIDTPAAANEAHYEIGAEIRSTLKRMGAPMPEDLPPAQKSIQQLQQEEQKRLRRNGQMSLFGEEDSETG